MPSMENAGAVPICPYSTGVRPMVMNIPRLANTRASEPTFSRSVGSAENDGSIDQ